MNRVTNSHIEKFITVFKNDIAVLLNFSLLQSPSTVATTLFHHYISSFFGLSTVVWKILIWNYFIAKNIRGKIFVVSSTHKNILTTN